MIEVGILKTWDSVNYKAGVQLAGSLTTYFDNIPVSVAIPSSAMVIGNRVILSIPEGNPKDAVIIATWPGGYVPKFTPKAVAKEVWRRDDAENSSLEALINGAPTATSVVYDTDVRGKSLPNFTSAQFGVVILHNITRGNSRRIAGVNLGTKTLTTESSVDDWADNDIITIGSQTCISIRSGHTYSSYFDLDISAEVPATAFAVMLEIFNNEKSGVGAYAQNNFGCHPYEVYGDAKAQHHFAGAAYEWSTTFITLPLNAPKVCVQLGRFALINASGTIALIRLRGYWE